MDEIIDYPRGLPLPIRADKNRTTETGFRTDQPQYGPPIFVPVTHDLKTTWNVRWVFKRQDDRRFDQWLRSPNYLDNANRWFRLMVDLGGSGLQEQVVHFLGMPIQTSIVGETVSWSGNIICRKLNNTDDEFGDLIVELLPEEWGLLDIVVTERLPRCKGGE